MGEALFQKLRANEFAMDFIKKRNNVQIIFDAVKDELNKVESTIKIYYDNPSKGQFRNLVDRIFFRRKKIELSVSRERMSLQDSLEDSFLALKSLFVHKNDKNNKDYNPVWSGLLDWRLERINKKTNDKCIK